jgi:predicted  nucleic acid-binding Zn-ribbon protein
MNTYRIYEDFKATLGDAAAQSLAKTLGTMFEELKDTVTKEDFRILRESIDANVSRLDTAITRLADAQVRTEAKLGQLADGQLQLAKAQSRTEQQVKSLAEAQTRTEAKLAELADGQSRLAEAQSRTEAKLAELADGQSQLAEAQSRTEQQVKSLAEAQSRTEQQVKSLAEAQSRTEQQVKSLAEAQTRTEQEVKTLAEAMQRLTIRTDAVVGRTFELQVRDRLTSYLGRFLRRGKVVSNDTLLDAIEPSVTTQEIDDFLRADVVAKGLVDGVETYVVVEVSSTGDTEDIVRADARAGILRKAGLAAIPLVACDVISPESLAFANRLGVRIWCNGSLVDAAA